MILTHPLLFNSIVVLFVAFTAGWLVFVFSSKGMVKLKRRVLELEREKDQSRNQMKDLEQQLEKYVTYPLNSATVITLSSSGKVNKTN